jgi:putative hydrolase of the HAD superfamily
MERPERDWLVVFDLDDTLYPEAAFIKSGLAAIEGALQRLFNTPGFAQRAWAWWQLGEHERMFELALEEVGLPRDAKTLAFVERLYVSHTPDIDLYPDVLPALGVIHMRTIVAILTDGPSALQQRKINALGLEHFVHKVVLTDEWGRGFWKPHPRGFVELQEWAKLPPGRCLYAADNPLKDFHAPRKLGWQCLRVRRRDGRYAACEVPEELGMVPYCRYLANFEEYVMPRKGDLGIEVG